MFRCPSFRTFPEVWKSRIPRYANIIFKNDFGVLAFSSVSVISKGSKGPDFVNNSEVPEMPKTMLEYVQEP